MTLPTQTNGYVVLDTDWNALVNQINANSTNISSNTTSINTLNTRTTDASTGNTALGTRVTTLEGAAKAGAYVGDWTDNNAASGGVTISNATGGGANGVKVTDIGVVVSPSPVGCSMASGTFTPTVAGKWAFDFSVQFAGGSSAMRAIYLAISTAANTPSGVKYGLQADVSDAISSSARIILNASQSVSIYCACWTTSGSVQVWRAQGNLLSATWIGP